jgi:hypothetical protein
MAEPSIQIYQLLDNSESDESTSTAGSSQSSASSTSKRGAGRDYAYTETHTSQHNAEQVVNDTNMWTKRGKRNRTKAGYKQFYRCNKPTARSTEQCDAALYILYPHDKKTALIFETTCKKIII